VELRIIFRTIF